MSRFDDQGAQLVRELQAWLWEAAADEIAAPAAVQNWLHHAPRSEIARARGYVKPNPRDDVAMHEAGMSHRGCPDWCEDGCRCFIAPPCSHCTDHEPPDRCGCPAYQLADTGQHGPACTSPRTGMAA